MGAVDSIDLAGAASVELVKSTSAGENRISLRLPMDLGLFASVLCALAPLGFEFDKTVPETERGADT